MSITKDLLEILVCPETKQDLTLADEAFVAKLNKKISDGGLKNRSGEAVKESVSGALIRFDKKYLYLIREDIPIMLIDEAISMEQL